MNVPSSLRPFAARVRRRLVRALGAMDLRDADTALRVAVDDATPSPENLDAVLNLLYPDPNLKRTTLKAVAVAALGGEEVHGLADIRRVLAAADGLKFPSPVEVRFGSADVTVAEVGGLRLVLDSADASVLTTMSSGSYEPHVVDALGRICRPGMTVVDVGAHIGYLTICASRIVGPAGRVIAVEANSENCRLLLATVKANAIDNVTLLPVAVDDHQGWSYFMAHVGSNGGLAGGEIYGHNLDAELVEGAGHVVATFTLDQLVTKPVDVVKIDVEGAEYRVVKGAARILDADAPYVISEVSREMLHRVSATSLEEYLALFTDRGYRIAVLERDGSGPRPVSATELTESWPHHAHIEDLLLTPPGRPEPSEESWTAR